MIKAIFFLCFSVMAIPVFSQETEQKIIHRLALIIGNKAYAGAPWQPLLSPIKDAQDIKKMLLNAGFEIDGNTYLENATGKNLRNAVDNFGTKVRLKRRDIIQRDAQDKEAIVVIVFFSGHGYMSDDAAYLAGVDAKGKYIEEVVQQSVKLNRLAQDLTPDDRDVDLLSILLIDACRSPANLPSITNGKKKSMMVNSSNPFKTIAGVGRISVFATTEGKVSFDGRTEKENSVFTTALLEAAVKPEVPRSFSDYVNRIEVTTPRIAKQRFVAAEQYPEVYKTGVAYDFPWTYQQAKAVETKVQSINNMQGVINSMQVMPSTKGNVKVNLDAIAEKTGWIWIGDYSNSADSKWTTARFAVNDSKNLPAPKDLKSGQEIEIRANLNVRDKFPIKDNNCTKKYQECAVLLGTLPKGLNVVIMEEPKAYGHQHWVKVKFNATALY